MRSTQWHQTASHWPVDIGPFSAIAEFRTRKFTGVEGIELNNNAKEVLMQISDISDIFLQNDAWVYYAVVSVPANILNFDEEPLGPNTKGFLMHRTLSYSTDQYQPWSAGYFLLK